MKDSDKNKESSHLKYWDVNNLYGWAMSQKLSQNKLDWIENTSQFNEDFVKDIMKKMMTKLFLKLMLNTQKNYMDFIMTYHLYLKEIKLKKQKNLLIIYVIKWICHSRKKFKTSIKSWINFEKNSSERD